jgi:hypothetical protein
MIPFKTGSFYLSQIASYFTLNELSFRATKITSERLFFNKRNGALIPQLPLSPSSDKLTGCRLLVARRRA